MEQSQLTDNNVENSEKTDDATLAADVRQAVSQAENVAEAVRKVTYEALSTQALDLDTLRRIINMVVEGARQGVQQELQQTAAQVEGARARFAQAMAGLDAALAQFAVACKLTLEEAVSRAEAFTRDDLAKVRADLEGLESLFLEVLKNSAEATKGFVADTLREIVSHAERHGTAVGRQLQETLASLTQHMAQAGRSQLTAGLELAQATAKLMRDIAAGVLGGLADRLKTGQASKDQDA